MARSNSYSSLSRLQERILPLSFGALATVFGLWFGLDGHGAPGQHGVLEVKELIIRDSRSRIRLRIHLDGGNPVLSFFDRNGGRTIQMQDFPDFGGFLSIRSPASILSENEGVSTLHGGDLVLSDGGGRIMLLAPDGSSENGQ